jgi:phosphomannomutase/phosphoglucomutase
MVEPSIFRKYDIRGLAIGSKAVITPDVALAVGRAFGSYIQRALSKKQVVIGRDNRVTSDALAEAAIVGLRQCGCNVIDLGTVSTPVLYWFAVQTGDSGGLMITGSHLTPDQNGFKLCVGTKSLYGDQIGGLRQAIETDDFESGNGNLTVRADAIAEYTADLVQRLSMPRPLKVVVDAGNGTASLIADHLIRQWGHDVAVCLYCESDGTYPNHQPDPQKLENMQALIDSVRDHQADIGLAFDGDADRVGVVDDAGNMIASDRVLALLAKDLLTRQPGATVVADVGSSQVVFDEVREHGGNPIMWNTGHSLIKAKMLETGALLAGEISGHMFFAEDYLGFDDAYFGAGRLLQLLGNRDESLSELDAAMPRFHSTPVYRPHSPPETSRKVMQRVQSHFESSADVLEVNTVDGLRVRFAAGWGGLRMSNTEPVLSMRFEGATEADALRYRDTFFAIIGEFDDIDLSGIS